MKFKPAVSYLALLFVALLLLYAGCLDNSEQYRGEEKNGLRHGYGFWTHSSGARYIGYFNEGLRHGTGTWSHPNGSYYIGEWANGKYDGTGILVYSDGAKYMGQWAQNKKHGFGVYTWANGRSYRGQWVEDEMHGFGSIRYPDGAYYQGYWEKSLANGPGIRVDADGFTEKGLWENGKFLLIPVESLAFIRGRVTLIQNGPPATLEVMIIPPDATAPELIWESSDPRIATVEDGVVTPLNKGQTVIMVTTADGLFETRCTVIVNEAVIPATGVYLNYQSLTLTAGGAPHSLIATIYPGNATNKAVTWSSDHPAVAVVNASGVITPLAPGEAVITVVTLDGRWAASCYVFVNPAPVPPPPPPDNEDDENGEGDENGNGNGNEGENGNEDQDQL